MLRRLWYCFSPGSWKLDLISTMNLASPRDIDLAVAAARNAFASTWGKNVTGYERARLISKLADLIERDAQELAELESLNNGKPVKIARYVIYLPFHCRFAHDPRDFDIGDSVQCLRYYAGWADKIIGQVGPVVRVARRSFNSWLPSAALYHYAFPNSVGSASIRPSRLTTRRN